MARPALILVSGPPATGKTTVAVRLAKTLPIPLVSKDMIKESLFESLGWKDREWSRRLGAASMNLMFELLDRHVAAGQSVIAESNFYPEYDRPRLTKLQDRYTFATVEVHCRASHDVILARFREREESVERHPGHAPGPDDHDRLRDGLVQGTWNALNLGGQLIEVDTTDFDRIDLDAITDAVGRAIGIERTEPEVDEP